VPYRHAIGVKAT